MDPAAVQLLVMPDTVRSAFHVCTPTSANKLRLEAPTQRQRSRCTRSGVVVRIGRSQLWSAVSAAKACHESCCLACGLC